MLISIIVPSFNESKTIIYTLEQLKFNLINYITYYEVIVVDDGSTDNTQQLLEARKDLYHCYLTNIKNSGKGSAIKKGLNNANGQYVIFHDADLEYDSSNIIDFIKLIEAFSPDLIVGSRKNYKNYTRSHNILNYYGNRFISFIFNILNNTTFSDIYTCYICYKRDLINPNNLRTYGWEQHAEILSKIVKKGKKFYEIPINYNGRTIEEGKKIKAIHIISVIYSILKFKFLSSE
jgi:glycosyltransferase involved in cell wall biosynthesis